MYAVFIGNSLWSTIRRGVLTVNNDFTRIIGIDL